MPSTETQERVLTPEDAPYYVRHAVSGKDLWRIWISGCGVGPDVAATGRLSESETRAELRHMQLAWYERVIRR